MLNVNTHTYTIDGREYKSVTTILKDEGFIKTFGYNEEVRMIGEQCHKLTHAYDLGLSIKRCPELYIPRFEQYKKFRVESGFRPEFAELELCNPVLNHAGMADRLGWLNGERWVIDLKFSSAGYIYWHEYQTMAYAMAAACHANPAVAAYAGAKRAGLIITPTRYMFIPHNKIEGVTRKWTAISVAHMAKQEARVLQSKQDQEDATW
jgi:hypothetical protein